MRDIKLYFTPEEWINFKSGDMAFGYAFDSLMEAHRFPKKYYGDITVMQKVRFDKVKFYGWNDDLIPIFHRIVK